MNLEELSNEDFHLDEDKDSRLSLGKLRQETELFHDEDYIPHKMINVKRVQGNRYDNWQIYANKEPVLLIKGERFSKKEREFLNTVDGVCFLVNGFKNGWKTVSEYKRRIKEVIG